MLAAAANEFCGALLPLIIAVSLLQFAHHELHCSSTVQLQLGQIMYDTCECTKCPRQRSTVCISAVFLREERTALVGSLWLQLRRRIRV